MKKLLLKFLINLIGENPFSISTVDTKVMQDWLYMGFKDEGYKQYYTLRKKYIQNELTIGMEDKEYWKRIGRMEELRALNENILSESKRREKNKKQILEK
jgi:exonuclease V gamma subunit